MSALSFSERMSGWISFDELSYNQAMVAGRRAGRTCEQRLTIRIDDLDRFVSEPDHLAEASGSVFCEELGGELMAERGWFNLFVADGSKRHRRMLYRLFLRDGEGRPLTLSGFKDIQHVRNLDGWGDTSRLLVRILRGHHEQEPEGDAETVATGILHVSKAGFAKMLASMRGTAGPAGIESIAQFEGHFTKQMVDVFAHRGEAENNADWPSPSPLDARWQGHQPGEWHDLVGHEGLHRRIIPFTAGDGMQCTLHHIRGADEPWRGPVLLAHGCSVRANMFYGAPTEQTLAGALVRAGYDVWAENWRGSIDLPATAWTLDEVAAYDHPAAVEAILAETQAETCKAIVHCQGSTSFTMAAVAGLLPQVTDIVSNAVSLHVSLTPFSRLRLKAMAPPASLLFNGVDPQWTARPPAAVNRALALVATAAAGRRCCHNDICRSANFFYGVGPNVLWKHENLNHDTHEWNSAEWGFCPLSFFKQMGACATAGHLVPTGRVPQVPADLIDGRPQTDARFTFIAGADNTCFLAESQRRTHAYFDAIAPGRHDLHILPGYTHLDVFLGREAHRNVYPVILGALER
jgi:hypothetical protein